MRAVVLALGILGAVTASSSAQDYSAEFDRQWGLRMIGADKALAMGLDGRGVLVGVQDSGINATHYEFSGRIAPQSSNGLGGTAGFDWDNHGTHVAGIIAAGRNGSEMHGVASGATLMSLQIGGSTLDEWTTRARETLRFGVANNVRLFNASWGFTGAHSAIDFNSYRGLAQVEGFRDVVNAGGVMVFANGNEGSHLALGMEAALPFYLPELERGWLAVAAVGPTGDIAYYSQTCSVARLWCLAAPGGDSDVGGLDGEIYSTAAWGNHEYKQGTSMAAPHVTGALAVAKQLYPNASFQDLKLLALHTATDIGAPGIDDVYGWGLLNLAAMVETADPKAGTAYAQQGWTRQGVVNHIIDGLNPHASAARGGDWGWWAMPLGMSGTLGNTASVSAAGITAGVEGNIAPNWYAKMFGALSQSSLNDGGNAANDTGYHLGGQLLYETPTWFAEGTVGASVFSGVVQRGSAPGLGGSVIGGAGLAAGTSSSVDWAQWAALRFGYHLEVGEAGTVTPYLVGRVVNQNLSAFAETGSALGISGAAATNLSSEIGLGLKWMGPALSAGPFDIIPVLDVAYSRQDVGSTRSFQLLGNAMTASAGALGGDTLQVSASAEIGSQNSALDLKLGYTVQLQAGSVMHAAGLKLMGAF
jgi:subtilase-type serine protease